VTDMRIVALNGPTFRALAAGDLDTANATSPVPLSPYFAEPGLRGLWGMRAGQIEADPRALAWVTGVIWDEDRRLAAGGAGFHEPPGDTGTVEIGYGVDPVHQRRGYARAALEVLLRRAAGEPAVRAVRVSISPDNTASRRLTAQYGFVAVGEQIDDQDGLEIVYEISSPRSTWGSPAGTSRPGPS